MSRQLWPYPSESMSSSDSESKSSRCMFLACRGTRVINPTTVIRKKKKKNPKQQCIIQPYLLTLDTVAVAQRLSAAHTHLQRDKTIGPGSISHGGQSGTRVKLAPGETGCWISLWSRWVLDRGQIGTMVSLGPGSWQNLYRFSLHYHSTFRQGGVPALRTGPGPRHVASWCGYLIFFLASYSCHRCDKPSSSSLSFCVLSAFRSLVLPWQVCSRVSWVRLRAAAVFWGDPGKPCCDITMTPKHVSDRMEAGPTALPTNQIHPGTLIHHLRINQQTSFVTLQFNTFQL